MTCYGITADGLTVYAAGEPVLHIPSQDFPALIERLARGMVERNKIPDSFTLCPPGGNNTSP